MEEIIRNYCQILLTMAVECREIVDSLKEPSNCKECEDLQRQFSENPGGKPVKSKGLILAAIVGE